MYVYRKANWFAMIWTAAISVSLLYMPMYATSSQSYTVAPSHASESPESAGTATLADVNGASAYLLLLTPVLAALVPVLLLRWDRWRRTASVAAAVVLGVYLSVAVLSLGFLVMLYAPAVLALALAASGRMDGELPATA